MNVTAIQILTLPAADQLPWGRQAMSRHPDGIRLAPPPAAGQGGRRAGHH